MLPRPVSTPSTMEKDPTKITAVEISRSLLEFDPFLVDNQAYTDQFLRLSPVLFCDEVNVCVTECSEETDNTVACKVLRDHDTLIKALFKDPSPEFRIISISQRNYLSPFLIDEGSMQRIISYHRISPGFLDILSGFRDKRILSSEGGARSGKYCSLNSTSHDIFYQFRYPDRTGRSHGDPWSLRQTGVYHRFSTAPPGENLWVLLHTLPGSTVQRRLAAITSAGIDEKEMAADPMRIHVLILSSYVDNWRWYLRDISQRYLELEDCLLTSDTKEREEYNKYSSSMTFETLQTLRHLAGKLIPIPEILTSTISTISSIQSMNDRLLILMKAGAGKNNIASSDNDDRLTETSYHLASYASKLQSYIATAEVLQKRIENMTKFLADGLTLQNQDISMEISGHLLTLTTKDTVDDSATVRALTLVTLIYLPATFISGIFGMDFFSFQADTKKIQISPQFWIYVAATVPLMVMTLGYWQYRTRQQKKLRAALEARKRHSA